jgi:hypothetical protein
MFRLSRPLALLGLVGWLPLFAAAQTPAPKTPAPPAAPLSDLDKLRAKMLTANYLDGQLTQVDADHLKFTFVCTYQNKKPVPAEVKKLNELTYRFQAALQRRSTSLAELEKMQAEGRQLLKTAYEVEETPVYFELKAEKNLVVRTVFTPNGPDGKPLRSPSDLQRLRVPNTQPVLYVASVKDLDKLHYYRLYIDKSKKPIPPAQADELPVHTAGMFVIQPQPKEPDPFAIPGQ